MYGYYLWGKRAVIEVLAPLDDFLKRVGVPDQVVRSRNGY